MRISKTIIIGVLATLFIVGCSILKKDDPEKKIRAFLVEFEQSLNQNDETILSYFDVTQSKDAVLAAIRVLQNKDAAGVKCSTSFSIAAIYLGDNGIHIDIPAQIRADTLDVNYTENAVITFWLTPKADKFKITKLEGDAFYNQYVMVKSQVSRAIEDKEMLAHHLKYFETAKKLQNTYDTVVWVVNYAEKDYYYVVNGTWNEERSSEYSMGLVDGDGRIIIPVEFDLIGTPGFVGADIVEVKKSGRAGYYLIDGKPLIAAEYQWLAPYEGENVFALAKNDTTYGWISNAYEFKAGFPSKDAEKYILNYEYLPDQLMLGYNNQDLCEIPSEEYIGEGILIPPSYLTYSGLFKEVVNGFTMSENLYRGNVESIEASHSFVESIANHISAVVTTITERYLDGREEFYKRKEISFVNDKREIVASGDLGSGELTFKKIDSTYLEIQTASSDDNRMEIYDEDDDSEMNIPNYTYYQFLDEGNLQALSSNRSFAFTQFVKMDSSYVTGNFSYYDAGTQSMATREILGERTLNRMRNEILAEYGYIFDDQQTSTYFGYFKWYSPKYQTVEEFSDQLSEIDRYNLQFLAKMIGPIKRKEQV